MSTKVTIKSSSRSEPHPGCHIFHDVLDEFGSRDEGETPIHQRIDGGAVELQALVEGGSSVTITLPREVPLDGARLVSEWL